jgi:hypothetical protein
MPPASKAETIVKTVSPSGQISLGKKYAGKTVIIEKPEEGTWVIKTGVIIPENELWMHQEPAKTKIRKALEWAATHEPKATDLDEFEKMILAKLEERETRGQR